MRKDDIERMISLADDRYVEEMFAEKFRGGRKNIFLTFAAVAAGLALFAGGIGYLVSNAGNSDKITADDPLVYEPGMVDYKLYFQNYDESAVEVEEDSGVLSGATGISCYFPDGEYVKSAVPFDMSGFVYTDCRFAYNYNDELIGIMIHANNRTEDKQENVKILDVEAYEQGELFPHMSLGKCKSMKRFDVDVYGFDFLEESNTIGVLFALNGKEYLISGNYMSYDEIGIIMDGIIENGLWSDSFDIYRAEMEYGDISADITLEEANTVLPFAGHVPQTEEFGDMKLNGNVAYNAGRDEANAIVPKWLYFTYFNGSNKDICLQYFTYAANISPLENEVKLEDIEINRLSEFRTDGNHAFTIDCGGFKINVWANGCTDEEILNFTTAIRIGANGMEGYALSNITLEQANTIEPYAGYIPQSGNIGEITLNGVSYDEESVNGAVTDKNILVSYYHEATDKKILLYYDTFRKGVEPIPLSEVYSRLDSLAEPSTAKNGGADCKHYGFAIDCGEFIIKVSADCTPKEMIKCIMGINGLTDYSDGEEATKQFNLSQANMEEPYAGYVPQCMTIGSMSLSNVYVSNHVMQVEGYGYTANMDMFKTINVFYKTDQQANPQKYISLNYVAADPTSVTVVAFADCLNQLESLAQPSNQGNFDCRYYDFYINCGDFCIQVGGECTPGEMEQCIRGIWDSKDYTQYNITKLSLDEARGNELTAGYVPLTDKIGDMSLENGVCQLYELDGSQYIIVKYSNPTFKYDDERFNYYGKYLTAKYVKKEVSEEGVTVLDEIKVAPTSDLSDNGVGKYKFTLDCGDIYIRVEALCYYTEMWEFLKELKSVN